MKHHHYNAAIVWTGNTGSGTSDYRSYTRNHNINIGGKPTITASSDPAFRGDPSRHNPEELLVSALSSCHMLWYLHLCAVNNVVVTAYEDRATGVMEENADGSGQFIGVSLNPIVTVQHAEMVERAYSLHEDATHKCFIARSVNFDVHHKPRVLVDEGVTQDQSGKGN